RGYRIWAVLHVPGYVSASTPAHIVGSGDDDEFRHNALHLAAPRRFVGRISQVPEGEQERDTRRSGPDRERHRINVVGAPEIGGCREREVCGGFVLPAISSLLPEGRRRDSSVGRRPGAGY